MKLIELLAPARTADIGIEAINCGADAVYIGAEAFGARHAAGNSMEDIARLCTHAHHYGARVYVTVNTILYDSELTQVRTLVNRLHAVGVDALIVQDTALLLMDLPLPLHASTQMDIRSADKVRQLCDWGFSQAVLARELGLKDIAAIHKACPEMTLEAFVHGALCVSYSGRCYASQHCFGRSANRGECAQFCRLAFDLQDAKGRAIVSNKHLLSLKDMNRSRNLEQMLDAGIQSLKIEGRLKDIAYVKNTTAYYSRLLNNIIRRRPLDYRRASVGQCHVAFEPNIDKTFNRGFTDYFLHGRTEEVASINTPKAMGEPVGQVKEVRNGFILVGGTSSFHNGDGISYFTPDGTLHGFRVNRADNNRLYPHKMPADLKRRMFQVIGAKNALINKELHKMKEMAGIDKPISFHISRHSFAKMAKDKGLDNLEVKALLAHSNLATTQRYMGDFDTAHNDAALEKVFMPTDERSEEDRLYDQLQRVPKEILVRVLKRINIIVPSNG